MFTNDDALAAKLRSFAFHGKGETQYDNIHVGINSRLDTLQAAILLEKLAILEEEMVARQAVAKRYADGLGDVVKAAGNLAGSRSAWAQYAIETPDPGCAEGASAGKRHPLGDLLREAAAPTGSLPKLPGRTRRPAGFGSAAGAHPLPSDAPLPGGRGSGPDHLDDPQFHRQQFGEAWPQRSSPLPDPQNPEIRPAALKAA